MATIRPARWPDDMAVAQSLLSDYLQFLQTNPAGAVDICIAGYEEELAALPDRYSEPQAILLMAFEGYSAHGCVSVKLRADLPGHCEMKRLWTAPSARGTGLGTALTQSAMAWALEHGAHTLLLDTVAAAMPDAVKLYRRLGFVETERHNANPVSGLVFMKVDLR